MAWLARLLLQMALVYAVLDALWVHRWSILVAAVAGGLVMLAFAAWVLRHPVRRPQP